MSKSMPFGFILDHLEALDVYVRPMFGCHMVYEEERMLFFTGSEERLEDDFGICVATEPEYAEELRREFPQLRPLSVFGPKESGGWLVLPIHAPDFEETAVALCEMAVRHDPRVGRASQYERFAGSTPAPRITVVKTKAKPKKKAPAKRKK